MVYVPSSERRLTTDKRIKACQGAGAKSKCCFSRSFHRSYQDPGSCRTTSARSLHQDPNLYQDPLVPLASGSCRTTCARSLYQDPDLYQDPFGPLASGSCHITCAKSLYQDPCGLVLGSCRTTCARSLYQAPVRPLHHPVGKNVGPLSGIFLGHLYQDPVGPLLQGLCIRILFNHLCKICFRISL